jgi:hypothetical protein
VNFSLLLPPALIALLALAIPVLIHLSRRSELKLADFAAMRWLMAHLRPQRKWLLQERLLLAIRLLLLIAMALFLAQPIFKTNEMTEHWVLVTPGASTADIKNLPPGKNVQWHWLSVGFPKYDSPMILTPIAFSSLLRELDSQLPASTKLTVVVPTKLTGLDGQRIVLSRPVNWLITSGEMNKSTYEQENKSIQLAIRYDAKHTENLKYFRALQSLWLPVSIEQKQKNQTIDLSPITDSPPDKEKVLVWLASGELPKSIMQWVQDGGILLAAHDVKMSSFDDAVPVWQDAEHGVILRAKNYGAGQLLQWQNALTPSEMPMLLDAEFPDKLQSVLKLNAIQPSVDFAKQQMPEQAVMSWLSKPDSISSWFIFLILLLFAAERYLATRQKSWATS